MLDAVAQSVALRYRVAQRHLQRKAARRAYASLPFNVRLAHTIVEILKVAYSDNLPTLGLTALHAFHKAGITGEIGRTGITVEEAGKNLNSSKAMKPAMNLARLIMGAVRVKDPDLIDDAIFRVVEELQLGKVKLDPTKTVAQAAKFLGIRISQRVLSLKKHEMVKQKTEDPTREFLHDPGSLKSKVPDNVWRAFLKKIKDNPIFRDKEGRNRMLDWIQYELGASEYDSKEELARSMGLTERAFTTTWLRHPRRQKALQDAFEAILDYM